MAQMLAPYNNAMRLGQGFNSYTQQICLDQAVLLDTEGNRALEAERIAKSKNPNTIGHDTAGGLGGVKSLTSSAHSEVDGGQGLVGGGAYEEDLLAPKQIQQTIQVPGCVKPQIVTYSSRFVDKLSDVTGQCPCLPTCVKPDS